MVALLRVGGRELVWTIPTVAKELGRWNVAARAIPNDALRRHAVETLANERMNAEGAALFATLPRRRDRNLLRVLVAFQTALDYLDTLTEQPGDDEREHGVALHRSLLEALDVDRPISDYFCVRPQEADGGYLRELVEVCRASCVALPNYPLVKTDVVRGAERLSVQVLNHLSDVTYRRRALRAWAHAAGPGSIGIPWFEVTAASSSTLAIYSLLAAAAETQATSADVAAISAVYDPWACLACTMMDSLVDQEEDRASGGHSYVGYYRDVDHAAARIAQVVASTMNASRALVRGDHHAVVISGMVAMYLSKRNSGVKTVDRRHVRLLRRAAGWPVRVEVPVTRAMRTYGAIRRLPRTMFRTP